MRKITHLRDAFMAAQSQFLIRNRHSNQWYGRVAIPILLRDLFNWQARSTLRSANIK